MESPFPEKEEKTRRFLILLCLTMLGVGAALGFSAFYIVFEFQFSKTVQTMEVKHNETLHLLVKRLETVTAEKQQCLDDPQRAIELGELRAQLTLQRDLSVQYKELSDDYEELVDEIEELEGNHKELVQEVEQLDIAVDEREDRIEQLLQIQSEHVSQIESLQSTIHGHAQALEALNEKEQHANDCGVKSTQMQSLVQQRQSSLCREE